MSKAQKNASVREMIRRSVRAVDLKDGQIILIKQGSLLGQHKNFNHFMRSIGNTGRQKCIGIIVDSFDDLTILDEKSMNEHNWYRHEYDPDQNPELPNN